MPQITRSQTKSLLRSFHSLVGINRYPADWIIGVHFLGGAHIFSSPTCTRPISCPVGTGDPFPDREAVHSPPSSAKLEYVALRTPLDSSQHGA